MILDKLSIEKFLKNKNGLNSRQARLLDISFPLMQGWKDRLDGKEISEETFSKLIELKNNFSYNRKDKLKTQDIISKISNVDEGVKKFFLDMGFDVVVMGDRFRLNGCVDWFYDEPIVYDKLNGKSHRVYNEDKQIDFACSLAEYYGKNDAFKKTDKGNMSIREFRYRNHTRRKVAPYYHWMNDFNKTSDDHLYFIRCGYNVKIGRSKEPKERVKTLKTGMPNKYELLHVEENRGLIEKKLHYIFDEFKSGGGTEWFFYNQDIRDFISFLKKGGYVKSMYDINSSEFPENVITR